ncbi:hypothetical protein GCM10028803_32910 [Larkinella knui]|uniref:Uncharacterized protein n=1 Tax=Larkinella knui TaxID=2025310 RepID=A0A3P1CY99_9BACT|nr:hypothetical protein [Larkinella knui]RRB18305.1 hypothetical protein EHT87_08535 [Larkinella knui]
MNPEEEKEFNEAYRQMVYWLNEHLESKRAAMVELAKTKGKQGYTATQYAIMSFSGSTALFLKEVYEGKRDSSNEVKPLG